MAYLLGSIGLESTVMAISDISAWINPSSVRTRKYPSSMPSSESIINP